MDLACQTWTSSEAYSKLSAKSRAEFTAEHSIAATCSVACWKFAIFVYQISTHTRNIRTDRERSNSVGVKEYLQNWSENERQRTIPEVERHGWPEPGTARLLLAQSTVNWIVCTKRLLVLANPRKIIREKFILAYP